MSWQHFVPVQHSSLASLFLLLPFIFLSLPSANLKGNCLVFSIISQSVYCALVPVKTISHTLSCSASLPTHCYYPQSLCFLPNATWRAKYPSRGIQFSKIQSVFSELGLEAKKIHVEGVSFPGTGPASLPGSTVGTLAPQTGEAWHHSGCWRSSTHSQPGRPDHLRGDPALYCETASHSPKSSPPTTSAPPGSTQIISVPRRWFCRSCLAQYCTACDFITDITLILTSCSKPLR